MPTSITYIGPGPNDLYVKEVRVEKLDMRDLNGRVEYCLEIVATDFMSEEEYVIHIPSGSKSFEELKRAIEYIEASVVDEEDEDLY